MKRNRRSHAKGRLVTMILGKYAIFSIVLVILMFIVIFAAIDNIGKYDNVPNIKELTKEYSPLTKADYDNVDVESIIGKGGYVQVVDNENKVIYCSNKKYAKDKYTKDEIRLISSYNSFSMTSLEEFKTKGGKIERVLSTASYTDKGVEETNAVYVIDENLNILYSTENKEKKSLTQKEFNLLTNDTFSLFTTSKIRFSDGDGKERTLLAHSLKTTMSKWNRARQAFLAITVEFLAAYLILLLLFSLWISRRLKKPLKMLNQSMDQVSHGNTGTELEYSGPKEFVEICNSFNSMIYALNESEAKNTKLQQDKQKMIANISHDLKTPITVIKGYSRAICDGIVKAEDQEKYLQTIYQKSEELNQLINEFHDYAKLEHPDRNLELEDKDICEYTREYFAARYNEFDFGGYQLEVEIPEEKIMVKLDLQKFRRVYDNITNNFFKYNQLGATFYCFITQEEGRVVIVLGDNGIGIPIDLIGTLFEPFIVGEESRNRNGSGLGLTIAKQIVEKHNGTIELVKIPEKGMNTQFIIRL